MAVPKASVAPRYSLAKPLPRLAPPAFTSRSRRRRIVAISLREMKASRRRFSRLLAAACSGADSPLAIPPRRALRRQPNVIPAAQDGSETRDDQLAPQHVGLTPRRSPTQCGHLTPRDEAAAQPPRRPALAACGLWRRNSCLPSPLYSWERG